MYKSQFSHAVFLALTVATVMLTISACGNITTATATLAPAASAIATSAATPTPSGPFPVGDYLAANPHLVSEIQVSNDGTYSAKADQGEITGTYVVTGNQIEFTETKGACPHLPGTYMWTFDGTTLKLQAIKDHCSFRQPDWEGAWTKQP